MVQASTATLIFLTEVFGLLTCSLQEHFPGMGRYSPSTFEKYNMQGGRTMSILALYTTSHSE